MTSRNISLRQLGNELVHCFDDTAEDSSDLRQVISLGERNVTLIHHSTRTRRSMGRAFEHLEIEEISEPTAELRVGSGRSVGLPRDLTEHLAPGRSITQGSVVARTDGQGILVVQPDNFSWWDAGSDSGIWWAVDNPVRPSLRATPMRSLLGEWGRSARWPIVHGAAVGVDDRVAVIAAAPMSGKSTLSIAALLAGMTFYGDDYFMLDIDHLRVIGLYATAMLDDQSLSLLGSGGTRLIVNEGKAELGRSVIDLADDPLLGRTGSISTLIVPTIVPGASPQISPLSPMQALRSIALTSTVFSSDQRALALEGLGALCRNLPCFQLIIGDDPFEALPLVRRALG